MKIGVPSKGRLMEQTFDWFGARGLTMRKSADGREYAGTIEGAAGVELVLLSAGEIPYELAAGRIHLGVTGTDMIREKLADWAAQVQELTPLGFGQADLIIAVPQVWIDVDTLDDLDAAAAAFRISYGHRLRIATKYHRLVRDFLTAHGVADYQLVDSQGATEGTVKNGSAEAIADITSSGETLRANHLKTLSDGLILQSEATLYAARTADWGQARRVLSLIAPLLGLAATRDEFLS
jgi:ATP phosphoribosyltransferase